MEPKPSIQTHQALLTELLQAIADNPDLIAENDQLKALIAKINKTARKQNRLGKKRDNIAHDTRQKEATQLFQKNDERQSGKALPSPEEHLYGQLKRPQNCYCCKQPYTLMHFFYHQLCPACATKNYAYRNQSCDLKGRVALVTGGRVKIGYELALMLLRFGAHVILTTRFPVNASEQFKQELDHASWNNRLDIYGLDLRNLPAVEQLITHIQQRYDALDILINNAAQTIKRPLAFYSELLQREKEQFLLDTSQDKLPAIQNAYFPAGQKDIYGQQADLRPENSWVQPLEEVDALEMLEVQLVNMVSPFLLNSQLKPLLLQSKFERRFIVNVSAVEGQFNRSYKSPNHPHTNMAKAGLNMMTRTSAEAYAKDGIFMTSVDTGWITDENPKPKAEHLRDQGFVPPLDVIDGAARVLAPVVDGINKTTTPLFGVFLKDYDIAPW